jgi:hypothetical protein
MASYTDFDVAVIGGGPAGTAASIASARMGARTLLVEQDGYLGGMASAGMVVPHFEPGRCSISLEMIDCLKSMNGWGSKNWDNSFDPELWKICSERLAISSGVKLLFHTSLTGATVRDEMIEEITLFSKNGSFPTKAKVYVDSTGDGDLAFNAGVPFEQGRSGDHMVQPVTLIFRLGDVDYYQNDAHQLSNAIEEAKKKASSSYKLPYDCPWIVEHPIEGQKLVMLTHIYNIDPTNPWDLTKAEIEGRKQAFEAWSFLKKHIKGFERSYIVSFAARIGVRETRRFIGEYMLNEDDVMNGRKFEDAIAQTRYPIDIHEPNEDVQTNIPIKSEYDIPYRCLLPKGIQNLLLSGRNISGTHKAHASYRVKGIAMATGQAAGVAAGLAASEKVPLRQVPIDRVQHRLAEDIKKICRQTNQRSDQYQNFPKGCKLETYEE